MRILSTDPFIETENVELRIGFWSSMAHERRLKVTGIWLCGKRTKLENSIQSREVMHYFPRTVIVPSRTIKEYPLIQKHFFRIFMLNCSSNLAIRRPIPIKISLLLRIQALSHRLNHSNFPFICLGWYLRQFFFERKTKAVNWLVFTQSHNFPWVFSEDLVSSENKILDSKGIHTQFLISNNCSGWGWGLA